MSYAKALLLRCVPTKSTTVLLNITVALSVLQNCTLFPDAAIHNHCSSSTASVYRYIGSHLKMAPHRQGGAGKGCHVPA